MPGLSLLTVRLAWYCLHYSYWWGLLCISLDQLEVRMKEDNRSWLWYPVPVCIIKSVDKYLPHFLEGGQDFKDLFLDPTQPTRKTFLNLLSSALVIKVCWFIPWLGLSDTDCEVSHCVGICCWVLAGCWVTDDTAAAAGCRQTLTLSWSVQIDTH